MNWLEVIKLRASEKDSELVEELFRTLNPGGERGLVEIRFYRHEALETDLAIHLHWNSEGPKGGASDLGLRLARALEGSGLVDHSAWIEAEAEI